MKVLRCAGLALLPAVMLTFLLACGDTYRPVANPIVGPGGQPARQYHAYVASYNPVGQGASTEIDVSGDSNMFVQYAGLGTTAQAFLPNGIALFMTNSANDTVTEFQANTTTPVITTIGLYGGSHPVSLASTDNTTMYVGNSGFNSACPNTGSVSAISSASLAVTNTVCVGLNPGFMVEAIDAGKLYILNEGSNSISVYNPTSKTVTSTITATTGLGLNPIWAVASTDGSYIFVVCAGNGSTPGEMDIITIDDDAVSATMPLGLSPSFITLDTTYNRLYVANTGSNTISVFDASNVNVAATPAIPLLATANVGSAPVSIAPLPSGTSIYVANSRSNTVTVLDAKSFLPVATVPVGQTPIWIAAAANSTKVYTANRNSYNISIINVSNNSVVVNMPTPQQDPLCQSTATAACPLQQPISILTE